MAQVSAQGEDVPIHLMSYEQINDRLFELIWNLIKPGYNVTITAAHVESWAWTGELLFGPSGRHNVRGMLHGPSNIGALLIKLATQQFPSAQIGGKNLSEVAHSFDPKPYYRYLLASESLGFVAFPYLEGLLKERCAEYVRPDGVVVKAFARYGTGKAYCGRLSNLGHALHLFMDTAASRSLVLQLSSILTAVADVEEIPANAVANRGCEAIFRVRNRILHGEGIQSTVAHLVITLALLIALDEVGEDYEFHRRRTVEEVQGRVQMGMWHRHSFFPPG